LVLGYLGNLYVTYVKYCNHQGNHSNGRMQLALP
jgi:hypothetical protein